jgi:protein-tyrosine-phosphatase
VEPSDPDMDDPWLKAIAREGTDVEPSPSQLRNRSIRQIDLVIAVRHAISQTSGEK